MFDLVPAHARRWADRRAVLRAGHPHQGGQQQGVRGGLRGGGRGHLRGMSHRTYCRLYPSNTGSATVFFKLPNNFRESQRGRDTLPAPTDRVIPAGAPPTGRAPGTEPSDPLAQSAVGGDDVHRTFARRGDHLDDSVVAAARRLDDLDPGNAREPRARPSTTSTTSHGPGTPATPASATGRGGRVGVPWRGRRSRHHPWGTGPDDVRGVDDEQAGAFRHAGKSLDRWVGNEGALYFYGRVARPIDTTVIDDVAPAPERSRRRSRTIIAVLSLCGTVVALQQTMVVPLLPEFPGILGVSRRRRVLAGHRHPADQRRGHPDHVPAGRHVRQAADDAGLHGRDDGRLGGRRASAALPRRDHRRGRCRASRPR